MALRRLPDSNWALNCNGPLTGRFWPAWTLHHSTQYTHSSIELSPMTISLLPIFSGSSSNYITWSTLKICAWLTEAHTLTDVSRTAAAATVTATIVSDSRCTFFRPIVCEKIHQFLSSTKKDAHKRIFSASQCIYLQCFTRLLRRVCSEWLD